MSLWADLPLRTKGLIVVLVPLLPLVAIGAFTWVNRDMAAVRPVLTPIVLLGTAAGVFAGAVVAVLFTRGITMRVERLRVNADRLADRRPLLPMEPARDELGRLAARLEQTARRLREEEDARREAVEALERSAAEVRALNERLAEQVRHQQELNQELESFAYSVSHDLRAPLRHIIGFTTLLEEHLDKSLDDDGRRLLSRITGSAQRLTVLIEDLLSFSRMGRMEMLTRPLDLADVIAQARQEVEPEAGTRRIEWKVGPLPRVLGDADMLRLAFGNLLSNAIKYTAPREEARIEVGEQPHDGKEAVIFVRDNGVGFDMKHAPKLFGVFQRLHSAAEFHGTGIGLANVRRIVQRHGGRVWAEAAVGQGATFFVALPRAGDGAGTERGRTGDGAGTDPGLSPV
ncbi:MAG TPA: ATP-binding protein [Vicinamibacterales bacterium]|nr:ATP-binding protein [Vicinamibacterales bacterium]